LSGVLPADVRIVTAHKIGSESNAGEQSPKSPDPAHRGQLGLSRPDARGHHHRETAGLLRRRRREFTSFDRQNLDDRT
jgi:hypothetical protein